MFNFDTKSTRFKIFCVILLLIAYGHLYPFQFKDLQTGMAEIRQMLLEIVPTSFADMASNVAVFIPFGFLGVRSFHSPLRLFLHSLQITLIGFVFAYLLQISQLFVETRVPSLLDALLNTAGCAIGAVAGTIDQFRFFGGQRGKELWLTAPLLLAGCIVLHMLLPLIPAMDLATLQNTFLPIYVKYHYNYPSIFKYFTFWLVFVQLISAGLRKNVPSFRMLTFICMLLLFQTIIASKQIGYSLLIGSGGAWIAWFFLRRLSNKMIIWIMILLLFIYQTHYSLYPFHFASYNQDFNWLPFQGFMQGDILHNTVVFFRKIFIFGSFMLFLEGLGMNWWLYTTIGVSWIGIMEVIQIQLEGHIPEISDPFITLLVALWLRTFRAVKFRPDRGEKNQTEKPATLGDDSSGKSSEVPSGEENDPVQDNHAPPPPSEPFEAPAPEKHSPMSHAPESTIPLIESTDCSPFPEEKPMPDSIPATSEAVSAMGMATVQPASLPPMSAVDTALYPEGDEVISNTAVAPLNALATLAILSSSYLLLLLYISLAPIDLHRVSLAQGWSLFMEGISHNTEPHLILNQVHHLFLWMPLSFCTMALLHRLSHFKGRAFFNAVFILTFCSITATATELAKPFLSNHPPMLSAMILKSAGALMGIMAWHLIGKDQTQKMLDFIRHHVTDSSIQLLFWGYLTLLLLCHLMPLDITFNPALIQEKWQAGQIQLTPFAQYEGMPLPRLIEGVLIALSWVLPAIYLMHLERLGFIKTLFIVSSIALCIETLQLLSLSRSCDTTDLVLALIGTTVGRLLKGKDRPRHGPSFASPSETSTNTPLPSPGETQPTETEKTDQRENEKAIQTEPWTAPVTKEEETSPSPRVRPFTSRYIVRGIRQFAIWALITMTACWFPYDFSTDSLFVKDQLARATLIPFASWGRLSIFDILFQLMAASLFYFPAGVLLARLMKGRGFFSPRAERLILLIWLIGVLSVAGGIEFGQSFLPDTPLDATDVILALPATWVGFWMGRPFFQIRRNG